MLLTVVGLAGWVSFIYNKYTNTHTGLRLMIISGEIKLEGERRKGAEDFSLCFIKIFLHIKMKEEWWNYR